MSYQFEWAPPELYGQMEQNWIRGKEEKSDYRWSESASQENVRDIEWKIPPEVLVIPSERKFKM